MDTVTLSLVISSGVLVLSIIQEFRQRRLAKTTTKLQTELDERKQALSRLEHARNLVKQLHKLFIDQFSASQKPDKEFLSQFSLHATELVAVSKVISNSALTELIESGLIEVSATLEAARRLNQSLPDDFLGEIASTMGKLYEAIHRLMDQEAKRLSSVSKPRKPYKDRIRSTFAVLSRAKKE